MVQSPKSWTCVLFWISEFGARSLSLMPSMARSMAFCTILIYPSVRVLRKSQWGRHITRIRESPNTEQFNIKFRCYYEFVNCSGTKKIIIILRTWMTKTSGSEPFSFAICLNQWCLKTRSRNPALLKKNLFVMATNIYNKLPREIWNCNNCAEFILLPFIVKFTFHEFYF